MKLSKAQKNAVLILLSYMSRHDVFSLARTITKNQASPISAKDAQEAIILHEIDLQTFLSRKKVTREILFKYLHDNRVDIPGNSDKSQLVSKIMQILTHHTREVKPSRKTVENETPEIQAGDVQTLAEKFTSWFYSMLNDYVTGQQSDKLCVEHFWNDCSLHLVMESATENVIQDVLSNSESVVNMLRDLQIQHKLYFNPNISSSGIRGKVDAHGLVMVMACGTLHQVNICVGIFQQIFGLVRDPFMQNNWRIKSTSIILRSQKTSQLPTLENECFNNLLLPS
ncbi:Uncharacterized protein GBIM_02844 [Gryllus bimaculatus]|nr:Uncharacterized protein GBIM_02844 [Gryllus bimaculatus]